MVPPAFVRAVHSGANLKIRAIGRNPLASAQRTAQRSGKLALSAALHHPAACWERVRWRSSASQYLIISCNAASLTADLLPISTAEAEIQFFRNLSKSKGRVPSSKKGTIRQPLV